MYFDNRKPILIINKGYNLFMLAFILEIVLGFYANFYLIFLIDFFLL
jgi:hypothetical protein